MIVQIYEVGNPKEAKELAKLGVDHIGVLTGTGNFPRELTFKQTSDIFSSLPKDTKKVALSLTGDVDEISELITECNPDILHAGARPEMLSPLQTEKLKRDFPDTEFMRAIPVISKESIRLALEYAGIVNYLLLDTYNKETLEVGATGKVHDWRISREIVEKVKIPVILAGGLGPENVIEAIKVVRPAGVDSKTKTDRIDGKGKDLEKVREFVKLAKSFS
jgi:phosphoribosylanthranilate isomerase